MRQTESENTISKINSNVFFREFTYSRNDFKDPFGSKELEFSDNVVWLDDIFIIFEIKEKESDEIDGEVKWFENKILNKAIKQVKRTHEYFNKYSDITIVNEKGHERNISQANLDDIQNVIIYSARVDFNEEKRHLKFYESASIGLIHLFHMEDYYWVCKYLMTPAEVKEYLIFREELFVSHTMALNALPEQYVLCHFFQTLDTSVLNPKFIENFSKVDNDLFDFNISHIIDNFNSKIKFIKHETEYYPIISEIARLNRAELAEFKKRFLRAVEKCKIDELDMPYRMYVTRTDCAFVFIPLAKSYLQHWEIALRNYTEAQKYDQRATKCIGVIVFEDNRIEDKFFEMYWMYIDAKWEFNEEIERLLKENYPFREAKLKQVDNRYLK